MAYHASGKPTMRTGSIVVTPADVRASVRYGNGVSATPYNGTDRNGMSRGIVRDVLRSDSVSRKVASSKVRKVRVWREDRASAERRIAGTIGNVE